MNRPAPQAPSSVDCEHEPSVVAFNQRDSRSAAVFQNRRPRPFGNAPRGVGGGDGVADHVGGALTLFGLRWTRVAFSFQEVAAKNFVSVVQKKAKVSRHLGKMLSPRFLDGIDLHQKLSTTGSDMIPQKQYAGLGGVFFKERKDIRTMASSAY
jgi:hypothetical protein